MIYIQNLIKTLQDRKLFKIDSLSINKNEKIALIGENGTGKTTLLRIILGLDKDCTGQVRLSKIAPLVISLWVLSFLLFTMPCFNIFFS